jgi:PAS domain S-box-containing protein
VDEDTVFASGSAQSSPHWWRRPRADPATQALEALLASIVEFLPDMVFVKDAEELRFVHLNRKAEELIGYPRADLLGKNDYDFFPLEEAVAFTSKDREVLRGREIVEIPFEPLTTPTGVRMLHTKKIPLFDGDGRPQYLLGISEDVTDRYQADQASQRVHAEHAERISAVFEHDCLSMVFQPIIDLDFGTVAGVEALARFDTDPDRPPHEWFAEAARVGQGARLELEALSQVLAMIDRLPHGVYVSVNVSPETVITGLIDDLMETVTTDRLVLELTEHAEVADYGALNAALARLRSMGVRVAVDDAGAGYSSLRHVVDLHPNIIKLDLAFTREIDTDPARRAVAAALVDIQRQMNSVVVAEGVETEAELNVLVELGVRYVQGFLMCRPTSLDLALATGNGRALSPEPHHWSKGVSAVGGRPQ